MHLMVNRLRDLARRIEPQWAGTAVAVLMVLVIFATRFTDMRAALDPYNLIAVLAFASLLYLYGRERISHREIIVLVAVTAVLIVLGVIDLHTGQLRLNYARVAVLMASVWLVARLLVDTGMFHRFAWIMLAILVALVAYRAFVDGTTHQNVFNHVFPGASRNVVGSWVIFAAAAVMVGRHLQGRPVPFWPAIIAVAIALLFATRMNIVVSILLLAVVPFLRFERRTLGLVLAGIALAGIAAAFVFPEVFQHLWSRTKFAAGGLDSPRYEIWRDYVATAPWLSLLFGYPPEASPMVAEWNGNPHSSLIEVYGRFGIAPFVFLAWLFRDRFRAGRIDWVVFVLLGVVAMRAATDILVFGREADVLVFGLLVAALRFYGPVKKAG